MNNILAVEQRMVIGFHATLRLADGRPIAPTSAARRVLARIAIEQGDSRGLLSFGTADDHFHATLATVRSWAGHFARYVACALRWMLAIPVPFEAARIRPIHDQRHAYNAFHYAHRQDDRHALALDPLREGTSIPDLLGLRLLPTALVSRVRLHLPRVRREDLVAQLPPVALDANAELSLDVLAEAAAAAFAIADVRARSADATRARRAAVHAVGPDVSNKLLSDCLGIGVRAVQLLRALPPETSAVSAVVGQARLITALLSRKTPT